MAIQSNSALNDPLHPLEPSSEARHTKQQHAAVREIFRRLILPNLPFGDSRDHVLLNSSDHLQALRKELGRVASQDFFGPGLPALFAVSDEPFSQDALAKLSSTASAIAPFAAQGFTNSLGALVHWHTAHQGTMPLDLTLERLRGIAAHTDKSSWIVLKNTIPRIVFLGPDSADNALAHVAAICQHSRNSAAKLIEYGFNDLFRVHSLTSSVDKTLEMLLLISKLCHPHELPVMRSLRDFLARADESVSNDDIHGLLTSLSEVYRDSDGQDRMHRTKSICAALKHLEMPISAEMFESLLRLCHECETEIVSWLDALVGISYPSCNHSLEPVIESLRSLKALLPKMSVGPILRTLTRAYQAKRVKKMEVVLRSCVDTFGAERTSESLDFLTRAVLRFSREDLSTLIDQLPNLREVALEVLLTTERIVARPITYIALRFISAADDTRNPWQLGKDGFDARWAAFKNCHLPSAITVPSDTTFTLSASANVDDLEVEKGATLDEQLLRSLERRFRSPSTNLKPVIINELAKMCNIGSVDDTFDPLSALVAVKSDSALFLKVCKIISPLLTDSSCFILPSLPASQISAKAAFNYLSSLATLLDDHIPMLLRERKLEAEEILAFREASPLARIRRELKKFRQSRAQRNFTCRLVAGKNIRGALIDQLGETCVISRYGQQLDHPQFEPIVLACEELVEAVGCVYALKGSVEGVPALIVAGVEPRLRWVQSMHPSRFLKSLYGALNEVAQANSLVGGVYINVGPPEDGLGWSDDGRMAQHERVRTSMIPPDSAVLRLGHSEQIHFPRGYSSPITYVVKV